MIEISYLSMVVFISSIWLCVSAFFWIKQRKFNRKRELWLILVYICVIVVVRFTFCPSLTDIDDLILNSLGFLMGYGLHLLVKAPKNLFRKSKMKA